TFGCGPFTFTFTPTGTPGLLQSFFLNLYTIAPSPPLQKTSSSGIEGQKTWKICTLRQGVPNFALCLERSTIAILSNSFTYFCASPDAKRRATLALSPEGLIS